MQLRDRNETYDSKIIKNFIRRRKKLFLSVSSLIFAGSILIALLMPKIYVSTATILIEGQMTEEIIRGAQAASTVSIEDRLQSITQQILSREKLLDIINQFHLYGDLKGREDIETAIKRIRENIFVRIIRSEDLDKRTAYRGRSSTVAFALSFQGEKPEVVKQVTSKIATLYIEKNTQAKESKNAQTIAVLQARVNQLKGQAELLGQRVSDFRRKHAGELPESVPINLEQLLRLNNQRNEINENIKILEAKETGTSQSSGSQLLQLRGQLDSLKVKYSDKHPDVIKTKNEIQRLEDKIKNTDAEQFKSSNSELIKYKQQREEIDRKIVEVQRKNQIVPLIQSELNDLSQEYENAMKQYNDTMSKLSDAMLMKGIEETQLGERFIIVDEPAIPHSPEKPQKSKIIFVGILLSIFVGFFVSIIVENLDHSIKSPDQLRILTKLPVLTVIPLFGNEEGESAESNKIIDAKSLAVLKKRGTLVVQNFREKLKI
jgi:uncharacterized protein involved in exopolysaccharide biosynthesis